MPRTLPWLTGASSKKEAPRKAQSGRKRSNSPADLVNSDLEPIGSSSPKPQRKPKKPTRREPSSSPPPAVKVAPAVEYMRDGFTMDDRFMMVEDEFTSTALLFSLPLHQDEYERARRRAKARGAETLKLIGHGTDGNAGQSRALRLKMKQEEMAKKRKAAGLEESDDDEEEYMADPQLAGLMTATQSTPRKSLRGFASNSQRTPRIAGGRTRDVVAEERVYRKPNVSAIEEDDDTDDEDEDDLDVFAPKARPKGTASVKCHSRDVEERATSEPAQKPGIFKQFTNSMQAERERKEGVRPRMESPPRSSAHRSDIKPAAAREPPRLAVPHHETDMDPQPKPIKMSRTAAILAKRREAEKKAKEDGISPEKQIKQELQSQVRVKEEPVSQTQGRNNIKREPSPSPARQALMSKSMAQRRAERAKKEADEKKSTIDDIPTFLY